MLLAIENPRIIPTLSQKRFLFRPIVPAIDNYNIYYILQKALKAEEQEISHVGRNRSKNSRKKGTKE